VEGIVRQEESRVSFQAALDPQTLEGRFDARVERIEPLAALLRVYGLSGRLQASGTLRGPWGAPVVQASLSGRNIRYQGFPADTLEARVSVREGRVVFSRLEAAGSLSAIDPAHPPLELKGWSGGFRYSGSLQGPTDALTGRISATLLEPGYAGVRFDRGGLEARLQGDRLLLDTIVLDRGSLRIAARGWLGTRPLGGALDLQVSRRSGGSPTPTGRLSASFAMQDNRRFTLQADGEGILLDLLQSLEAGLPDVGGALTFSVSAGGSLDDPRGEARVQVADPRFREVRMGSLSGRARLEEDGLRVEEVELQGEGAHFRASARLGLDLRPGRTALSGASPFSGEIEGQNVNLRILAPFLPPELRVEGSLSSRIAWSGTLGAPDPAGSLALSGGMVRLAPETPPVQGIELSATIRERALVLDRLNAAILEIPISLQGELRTPDWKEVRLNLTASIAGRAALEVAGSVSPDAIHLDSQVREINLQLASAVLPSLSKLGGTLNGTLSVRGKPADPQINGTVEARDVSMLLPGFPEPLSNGEIGLSFEGRRVTVQTLTARLGQGMVSLSGSFGYRAGGLESADLKAAARGMKLEKKGLYRLVIQSADLVYRGRGEQYVLEGDVVPGDSRLLQNFQPQAILAFLRSAERPAPQLPLFLEKTRLNIRLRGADNLWVQNNLGRVRIQAAVNVIGTPTRPVVTGRVSVEEGYVIFLDRRFTITHGIADFQDTRRLNPYIDLKARADVKYFQNLLSTQFAIVLSLRGPLDTLEVALSSDPPLNRSNILSLLALGTIRPGDDEGGRIDERSTGEIVIQRAGELASQQISEYVGKGVEDLLGLDQFSVTGNLFDIGGQNNPEIVASKRVNDRLELTYSTNIGPFDEHNLEMDYKLTDNLALQGRLNQEGEAEVRLKFGIKLK
jgi:translocation and assembly module TamB